MGDIRIVWNRSPIRGATNRDGLTPLFFVFSDANPKTSLTEADYIREAQNSPLTVEALKNVFPPSSSYKAADGSIAPCTYLAQKNGLCGRDLRLDLAKRVDLAMRALAQSDQCRWTGFDRGYNDSIAVPGGAYDITLHVYADCS